MDPTRLVPLAQAPGIFMGERSDQRHERTSGDDHCTTDPDDWRQEAIVASLEALGVTGVFGMPGGAILPTYDPLLELEAQPRPRPP